jgi:hypothetical protein
VFLRAYARRHRRTRRFIVARVRIPFCARCVEGHRQLVAAPTTAQRIGSYIATPAIISLIGSLGFALFTLKLLLETPPADAGWPVVATVFGFFALVAVGSAVAIVRETRRFRVAPQTEITRACDFSDNLGNVAAGTRHAYTIKDPDFARAFAAANAARLWDDAAKARARRRELVFFVVVLSVIVVIWWSGWLKR